jgi:CRISPR-associated exonuclease Cas4
MKISGSIIQAYIICPRQAWLMSRNICGNQFNEFLEIGRFLSEETYKREKKEIRIGSNVIDIVKNKNNSITIIETKKSSRAIAGSKLQLLYYLYTLKEKVKNIEGEIRIPTEKKIIKVVLDKKNINIIKNNIDNLSKILRNDLPPNVKNSKYCRKCSYSEFCWS